MSKCFALCADCKRKECEITRAPINASRHCAKRTVKIAKQRRRLFKEMSILQSRIGGLVECREAMEALTRYDVFGHDYEELLHADLDALGTAIDHCRK